MRIRTHIKLLLVAITFIWFGVRTVIASAQDGISIRHEGRVIGEIEKVDIRTDAANPSRTLIEIFANFPNFPQELDRVLGARGNMGGGTHRLYWRNNTSITGSGRVLRLVSRARYEWWPDLGIRRVRLAGVTGTMDWKVYFIHSNLSELRIGYRMTNIRGVWNDLERWFGLRSSQSTAISMPAQCGQCSCSKLFARTNPTLENTSFSHSRSNVDFRVTLAINSNLVDAVRCIGN